MRYEELGRNEFDEGDEVANDYPDAALCPAAVLLAVCYSLC